MEYHVRKEALPSEMNAAVREFDEDAELSRFLEDCVRKPHTLAQFLFSCLLSPFLPDYEVHGMLKMYPMHLLSTAQWEEIIPSDKRGGSLLDVGAGQGFVTERARELFSKIATTETSHSMSKRLSERGFENHEVDVSKEPNALPAGVFDVVSVLNVLDRCAQPNALLKNCVSYMKDDGILIISDPLPFHPLLRSTGRNIPLSAGGIRIEGSWEECLVSVYENLIRPAGLVPIRISRLPYVYKNTKEKPYVALDDFVMVCKKST